jgi:hypothetical protein
MSREPFNVWDVIGGICLMALIFGLPWLFAAFQEVGK